MGLSSKQDIVNWLNSQVGNTLNDKNYCKAIGYSDDNWCVDFGQYTAKQFGFEDYMYGKYRDVGTLADVFAKHGRLISRQEEPQLLDILIVTNHPNQESWRSEQNLYDVGWFPELDHFAWIVDVSHNDNGNGYLTCIAGNEGNDSIYRSQVRKTNYSFSRQALYCRLDDAVFNNGGKQAVQIILRALTSDKSKDRVGQVKNIQRVLNECGYKGADGKPLTIDGDRKTNTDFAIKAWKKNHGFDSSNANMGEKELKNFYSSD